METMMESVQSASEAVHSHLAEQNAVFAGIATPCCAGLQGAECLCGEGSAERALRAYSEGRALPPMSAAQREFCLSEISHVEGYSRADYENAGDPVLAAGVLHAWTDYARDQGLL